jgi:hypothetical protein
VTNLLVRSDQPVVTLSNVASPLKSQSPTGETAQSQPTVFSIPYVFTISNSAPTVVASNATGFAVTYSQTYTPGPLLWPIVGILGALIVVSIWLAVRRRDGNDRR